MDLQEPTDIDVIVHAVQLEEPSINVDFDVATPSGSVAHVLDEDLREQVRMATATIEAITRRRCEPDRFTHLLPAVSIEQGRSEFACGIVHDRYVTARPALRDCETCTSTVEMWSYATRRAIEESAFRAWGRVAARTGGRLLLPVEGAEVLVEPE